jgi:iron uptake system component EfeO
MSKPAWRPSRVGSRVFAVAGVAVLAVGLSACTKDEAKATSEVTVSASDTACTFASTKVAAGVVKFSVTNSGSKINEFYVYQGERALGEVEYISPSTTRTLNVELAAGEYTGVCKPGMVGDGISAAFTVSGESTPLAADQKLADAVANYRQYVESQAGLLVPATKAFTDAVRAGDIAKAKQLFPVAREHYEAIEPVAESFGDLDPAIDAREGDTEPGVEWTGYHVLEQHLWVTGDISGDKALADKLDADIASLAETVKTAEITPLMIANGAKELLDEVATSKITGEEDRYSHTDLWDFAANVAGAKAAVDTLRPALSERDAALMSEVDAKFVVVTDLLATHKVGDGYKFYTDLTEAQIKALADAVSGLAEPISKIAAAITQ